MEKAFFEFSKPAFPKCKPALGRPKAGCHIWGKTSLRPIVKNRKNYFFQKIFFKVSILSKKTSKCVFWILLHPRPTGFVSKTIFGFFIKLQKWVKHKFQNGCSLLKKGAWLTFVLKDGGVYFRILFFEKKKNALEWLLIVI